jgi:hypothetical protein
MQLPPLDFRTTFDFVVAQFARTGKDCVDVATELLTIMELHPQRLMLVAYFLWEQTGRHGATMQDLRLAHDAAMRSVDTELRVLWENLPLGERRVVVTIASGLPPFGAAARELAGIRNPSSSQKPLEKLRQRSIVVRDDEGNHSLLDPLFTRWVRRYGGARPQLYVLPGTDGRSFAVFDGPSHAFERSRHGTLDEAEEAAYALAAGTSADVMIYDTTDPNDLPDWAPR